MSGGDAFLGAHSVVGQPIGEAQFLTFQKIGGNIADYRKIGKNLIHSLVQVFFLLCDDTAGCFVHCPQRTLEPRLTEFLGQKDLVPGVQNDGSYLLGEVVFPYLAGEVGSGSLGDLFPHLLESAPLVGCFLLSQQIDGVIVGGQLDQLAITAISTAAKRRDEGNRKKYGAAYFRPHNTPFFRHLRSGPEKLLDTAIRLNLLK